MFCCEPVFSAPAEPRHEPLSLVVSCVSGPRRAFVRTTHTPAATMRVPHCCSWPLLLTLERGEAFISPCARAPAHRDRWLGYRSNPLVRPSTAAGVGQLRGGWSVRPSSLRVKKEAVDDEDALPTFKIQVKNVCYIVN